MDRLNSEALRDGVKNTPPQGERFYILLDDIHAQPTKHRFNGFIHRICQ